MSNTLLQAHFFLDKPDPGVSFGAERDSFIVGGLALEFKIYLREFAGAYERRPYGALP